mmetsp:Transcript_34525/g.73566  ORF Transcript_34525/g.73566 Transcript_34525/m.73566 type:complete len:81 (+) Transcript_34525:142-384(+)
MLPGPDTAPGCEKSEVVTTMPVPLRGDKRRGEGGSGGMDSCNGCCGGGDRGGSGLGEGGCFGDGGTRGGMGTGGAESGDN